MSIVILRIVAGLLVSWAAMAKVAAIGTAEFNRTWLHDIAGGSATTLYVLAGLELFAGVLLVVGFLPRLMALVTALAIATFAVWYWRSPARIHLPCGCFGSASSGASGGDLYFMARSGAIVASLLWVSAFASAARHFSDGRES